MKFDRRQFLKIGGISALGFALRSRISVPAQDRLYILAPPDALHPSLLPAWSRRSGVAAAVEVAPNPKELRSRLETFPGSYDLVLTPDSQTAQLISAGLLLPLDKFRISASKDLPPEFGLGRRPQDPANAFTLAAASGAYGIGYRDPALEGLARSWQALAAPEVRFALPDDGQLVISHYLRAHETPSPNPSPLTLESIRPEIVHLRRNALSSHAPALAMAQGRADLAIMPSAAAEWHGLSFIIPVEGSAAWGVDFAIPASSTNPELAHDLINFALINFPAQPTAARQDVLVSAYAAVAREVLWQSAAAL